MGTLSYTELLPGTDIIASHPAWGHDVDFNFFQKLPWRLNGTCGQSGMSTPIPVPGLGVLSWACLAGEGGQGGQDTHRPV